MSAVPSKGMQLGRKNKPNDFVNAMQAEGGLPRPGEGITAPLLAQQASAPAADSRIHPASAVAPIASSAPGNASNDDVIVLIEEQITMQAPRDGGLQSLEIKGDLNVIVQDPNAHRLKVQMRSNAPVGGDDVQFKVSAFGLSKCRKEKEKC